MSNSRKLAPINPEVLFPILVDNDLAWDVCKEESVRVINGNPTPIPGEFGLFKGQNGTDKFMNVGDGYKVLENPEFVELALQVANFFGVKELPRFKQYTKKYNGNPIKGGVIRAIIPLKNVVPNNVKNVGDIIKVQIILTNSHDGSHGLQWGLATEVLSCTNGMTMKGKGFYHSVRHLGSMTKMFQHSLEAFEKLAIQTKVLEGDITRLTNTPITAQDIQRVIEIGAGFTSAEIKSKVVSTRKANIAKQLSQDILREMNQKGTSSWALFNGITRNITHGNKSEYAKDYGSANDIAASVYGFLLDPKRTIGSDVLDQNAPVGIIVDDFQLSLMN